MHELAIELLEAQMVYIRQQQEYDIAGEAALLENAQKKRASATAEGIKAAEIEETIRRLRGLDSE